MGRRDHGRRGASHLPHLDDELALHRKHGYDVVYLDREAMQAEIASPIYHGGVWSRSRSGIVHPAKLAWELLQSRLERSDRTVHPNGRAVPALSRR